MNLPHYEHFQFAVGEFVQPKAVGLEFGKARGLRLMGGRGRPAMQIVERLYQECPGGVQLHYKVRSYFGEAGGYSREIDTFNEIELTAYVAPVDANAQ